MKTLVIYDSAFGNTKRLAEEIANELGADIVRVTDASSGDLAKYELLIVGSPIQGWRPLEPMTNFLTSLPPGSLKGIKAATLDTRISLFIHGDATEKMAVDLKAAGAVVVSSEYFFVRGRFGPLKKGELERAVAWAKKLTE